MSNERPDDFLSWRRTLSQPDALPEHGLEDRELSWEKLAGRLRDKPRRRWTGYWIAAACLLLLALIPVARLFRDHPRAESLRSNAESLSPAPESLRPAAASLRPGAESLRSTGPRSTALRPAAPQNTALPRPLSVPVPAIAPPAVSMSSESARPALISRHNTLPRRPAVFAPPQLATLTTNPVTPPVGPFTAALDIQPASGPSQPPPAKPKKQLRIVNINEITRGASPAPATATREPRFLRLGTTIPDPGPSSTDDPAILKIKLSPQNR